MKKKTIVTSIVSIATSLSLIGGSTFALFTDESNVNIAVTSGKVDVLATVQQDSLKLYSFDVEQSNNTFENGGTAEFDANGALSLNRLTPGDKATFTISVANNSNVAIQYRVKMAVEGELANALVASASMGENENTQTLKSGENTAWARVGVTDGKGDDIDDINVSVEFPNTDDSISKDNKDNEYQNKTANVSFTVEAVQGNAQMVDTWDGTANTDWYTENPTAAEFTLGTAEELAGLSQLIDNETTTFEGQTINLEKDMDFYLEDENGEPICFEPIGSYRNDQAFKGTFDGQGHTISNISQNTWALNNGYYYGDLGLGLFGLVEDATIKNLNMDGASISGESAIVGIVAATAYGECTFENITVKNSQGADYQYYAGGIVGWASGNHQYINCNVDASTILAAQWGDFDNSTGGVIGGAGGSAQILLKDCNVACRIDAYNDVTSTYQWYAYRRCGMLIGNTGKTKTVGNTTYADAPQLTCENVTVTYGDWANYTYCEFAGKSWPYVRVQPGVSNSAYSNPRYGHPTDANGNEVVDDNHVHNEGEDHFILCVFDQLYGGGQGVYGTATHDGVKVIYNNK